MISSSRRALPSTSQPSCIIDPIDLWQKLQLLSLEGVGIWDLCLFQRFSINFALAPQRCYFEPPKMLIFKESGLSKFSSSFDRRKRKKLRYFQRLVTPMMTWLGQKQQTLMCLHSLASDRRIYWCKDATLIMQGTSDQDAPQTSLICLLYKHTIESPPITHMYTSNVNVAPRCLHWHGLYCLYHSNCFTLVMQ